MTSILVVPGLRGSGPTHWQTWFESVVPGCRRVEQQNWLEPNLPTWTKTVRAAIHAAEAPVWLVAHSFGCLATVAAVAGEHERVRGALLVAPANPIKFGISALIIERPLKMPSLVVASENDPWVSLEKAARLAVAWGSRFVNIGRAGHINVDSGHGPWPDAIELFHRVRRQANDDLQKRTTAIVGDRASTAVFA